MADLHTKVSGARPPPTGPNSFVFTYVFTKKCLCRRLAPPPTRVGDPPTGNSGSAPEQIIYNYRIFCKEDFKTINVYLRFKIIHQKGLIITWKYNKSITFIGVITFGRNADNTTISAILDKLITFCLGNFFFTAHVCGKVMFYTVCLSVQTITFECLDIYLDHL